MAKELPKELERLLEVDNCGFRAEDVETDLGIRLNFVLIAFLFDHFSRVNSKMKHAAILFMEQTEKDMIAKVDKEFDTHEGLKALQTMLPGMPAFDTNKLKKEYREIVSKFFTERKELFKKLMSIEE